MDATSVYWTGGFTIMKVPLDGGVPTALTSMVGGNGIAVDATSVYWTGGGGIMKVPLDGGVPTTVASLQNGSWFIAVDATSVYWTNGGDGTVMKVLLGGGVLTTSEIRRNRYIGVPAEKWRGITPSRSDR